MLFLLVISGKGRIYLFIEDMGVKSEFCNRILVF